MAASSSNTANTADTADIASTAHGTYRPHSARTARGRDRLRRLAEYERKRDFSRTSEPRGERPSGAGGGPVYVVQILSFRWWGVNSASVRQ